MASKTNALRQGVWTAIAGWVPSPAGTWPSFAAEMDWYLTDNLEEISGLQVTVSPGAISGVPKSRRDIERTTRIAVQIAKKVYSDDEIDGLLELVERLDKFLYAGAREVAAFRLSKTEIQTYDWKMLEQKRIFHTILIATYISLE